MSSELALEVRGLAKEYVIGERRVAYTTLRDQIAATSARLVGRGARERVRRERIWALDDVSFDVPAGRAVGVIGRNGAGKTTLLKILARITAPTRGEVRITGQVGSLLEVGTGFHPELSGRDNVYLNGAILGMPRTEIRRKFDEIVAFAELERFIDTPVKWYSSGMYVRLAFSVAAHLEPDILIVDEVLAVGDASFQRKCLGKMDEVRSAGRTVVFVSHNMTAVRTLTREALWLDAGRVLANGPAADVVADYLASTSGAAAGAVADLTDDRYRREVTKWTAQHVRFESLALIGLDGEPAKRAFQRTPLRFRVEFRVREPVRFVELYLRVKTPDGLLLFASFSGQQDAAIQPGRYAATCEFPDNPLAAGRYHVELVARGADPQDIIPTALDFEVAVGHVDEQNLRYASGASGFFRIDSRWSDLVPASAPAAAPAHAARVGSGGP
jgi:lipopolysaccharide transport system ATP-binding protein